MMLQKLLQLLRGDNGGLDQFLKTNPTLEEVFDLEDFDFSLQFKQEALLKYLGKEEMVVRLLDYALGDPEIAPPSSSQNRAEMSPFSTRPILSENMRRVQYKKKAKNVLSEGFHNVNETLTKPKFMKQLMTLVRREEDDIEKDVLFVVTTVLEGIMKTHLDEVEIELTGSGLMAECLTRFDSLSLGSLLAAYLSALGKREDKTRLIKFCHGNHIIPSILSHLSSPTSSPALISSSSYLLTTLATSFTPNSRLTLFDSLLTKDDYTQIGEILKNPHNISGFEAILSFLTEVVWETRPADKDDPEWELNPISKNIPLPNGLKEILSNLKFLRAAVEMDWIREWESHPRDIPVPAILKTRGNSVGKVRLLVVTFLSRLIQAGYGAFLDVMLVMSSLLPSLLPLFTISPTASTLHCHLYTLFSVALLSRSAHLRKYIIDDCDLPGFLAKHYQIERDRLVVVQASPSPTPFLYVDPVNGRKIAPKLSNAMSPILESSIPKTALRPQYMAQFVQLGVILNGLKSEEHVSTALEKTENWNDLYSEIVDEEIKRQSVTLGSSTTVRPLPTRNQFFDQNFDDQTDDLDIRIDDEDPGEDDEQPDDDSGGDGEYEAADDNKDDE
ncbi:hypothetical protein BLNAU_598 [Blattamonas nauphoetae]|uniref:Uncharacterized protein n=1 Tax=Blattamonas nauphoetae TaxID=2049346 RepID=A0ABQ9YLP2_9EUKA|nr:hypothetical protein BLNAU_598 [Blattamonas nauphoetae]